MVLKTFDPKKADTIFSEEGEVCYLLLSKLLLKGVLIIFNMYYD